MKYYILHIKLHRKRIYKDLPSSINKKNESLMFFVLWSKCWCVYPNCCLIDAAKKKKKKKKKKNPTATKII